MNNIVIQLLLLDILFGIKINNNLIIHWLSILYVMFENLIRKRIFF